jgi:2-dehydropantoate 2-reductase
VGSALGARVDGDVDGLIDYAKGMTTVKSSMLQDVERGRPLEVDGILGAVASLGRVAGVPTPTLETVMALISLRGRIGASGAA